MDSRTHIELAKKLLIISEGNSALSVGSLFPQIDRNPPTLHRLYAHQVVKSRAIVERGLHAVLGMKDLSPKEWPFASHRFNMERERMLSYLTPSEKELGPELDSSDKIEQTMMAFVSHLYLDAFNQPTQVFVPFTVQCAGQWDLWQALGDFREALYLTTRITDLRQGVFADPLWESSDRFSPACLVKAMLCRMVSMGQNLIPDAVIAKSFDTLGMPDVNGTTLKQAISFLADFESLLVGHHQRVLKPTQIHFHPIPLAEALVKN